MNTDSSDTCNLDLVFQSSPFTFVDVPGFSKLWRAPERHTCGVYLWCIRHDAGYLVNYVGKTSDKRGFEGRLWDEFKDWRDGRVWTPVDIERFKLGHRVPSQDHSLEQHSRQFDELKSLYRILLAPIRDDCDCVQGEREIVTRLCSNPATRQFLTNARIESNYRPKATPKVRIFGPPIIGLTAPISDL